MVSAEVKKYYEDGKISDIYKICKKYFDLIDSWADKMIDGDLLNEYDLKFAQQQLNGCQTKLNPIAGALEAMVVEYENNYRLKEEESFEKMRTQDESHCRAVGRLKVSDLRRYASDFTRYSQNAQNSVVSVQSLLKRLTVEKGNKGIDFTGDTANVPQETEDERNWDE